MKRLFATLSLLGALGILPAPVPADAASKTSCLNESIDSCNADFGGGSDRSISIRGWCYMIRWGWCSWFD